MLFRSSFRDWWREIANDDDWTLNSAENGIDGGGVITGSYDRYAANGRKPYHSTNFVTCHDGFTMYDLFSYDEKNNYCSVINPVCCDDPYSVWCDTDSGESNNRSRDWGMDQEAFKRQLMRDMFVGMMFSYGTPMILGGDEWLRTQYGNNNAYSTSADNEYNWFRWGEWQGYDERWRMHDFVKSVIRLRKDHGYAFAPSEWDGGMPISWKSESNGDADWSSRHLMIHWYDDGNWSDRAELVALVNMERYDVTYTLPEGRTWERLVDTQSYWDDDTTIDEAGLDPRLTNNAWMDAPEKMPSTYTVPASTIVVMRER